MLAAPLSLSHQGAAAGGHPHSHQGRVSVTSHKIHTLKPTGLKGVSVIQAVLARLLLHLTQAKRRTGQRHAGCSMRNTGNQKPVLDGLLASSMT